MSTKVQFEIQRGPLGETAACLPFTVKVRRLTEPNRVFACRKCKLVYRVTHKSAMQFRRAIGKRPTKGYTTDYFVCEHMGRIIE